jgi:hypothetical protein
MRKTVFILGFLILCSGIFQTLFGERSIGILTLIAYVVITVPGFFTKNYIKHFPIEVEIILFLMVLLQFILGEARQFYTNVPYYDKFVHYLLPMFLGIIGFLIFYTLHVTEKLKTSITAMMFIIIFITLGLGALWEIFEYLSDIWLYPTIPGWHHFQGNAQQDSLTDTMTDLIDDTLGAVFGAFLGLWYMRKNYLRKNRATELVAEVDTILEKDEKKTEVST